MRGQSLIFGNSNGAAPCPTKVKPAFPASVKSKEVKSLSANFYPIEILNHSLDNTKFKNSSIENSKSSASSINSSQSSQPKKVPVKLDDLFLKDADFDRPKLCKPAIRKNQSFNYPPGRKYQFHDYTQRRNSLQDPTKTSLNSVSAKTSQDLGSKIIEMKESTSEVKPPEYKLGRNRSVSDGPRLRINTNSTVLEKKENKPFQRAKSPLAARMDADLLKSKLARANLLSESNFSFEGAQMKSNLSYELSRESLKLEKSSGQDIQSIFPQELKVIPVDEVEIHID
ncbi:hypothetical protein HDV04_001483 [Boothiomyces sp. JEL0838]|nr:hypothetical protein HDV04_001483 [Boothiomyces sp. JEL0838]